MILLIKLTLIDETFVCEEGFEGGNIEDSYIFQPQFGTSITPPHTHTVHQRIKYIKSACTYSSLNLLNLSPKLALTSPKKECFSFTLYSPIDLLRHYYGLWTIWTYILDIVHVMLESAYDRLLFYFTYKVVKENTRSRI